jgi:hypothetical protein
MDALPMLDTIAIRADWPLRDSRPDGWRKQLSNTSPIRISVKAARLKWAEVSLPKLLFGHNGRTIENQPQLDAALARLHGDLNSIADVPEIGAWQIWRADIAWNFDMKAGPLVLAHAALRVPGIHRGATLFDGGQCVSWLDANSRFKVMLYDKARKMHISGSILRAEISLCGHKLNRHFDAGEFQNFGAIYRVFRRIMAGIPPIQKPNKAANWQAALGAESAEIRGRILARLAHKPKGTFRRYRRMVEAAAANLPESFSWANILPDDAPPPPVHCKPRNQTRRGRHGGTPGLLK